MPSLDKLQLSTVFKRRSSIHTGFTYAKLFTETSITLRIIIFDQFEVNFLFIVALQNADTKMLLCCSTRDFSEELIRVFTQRRRFRVKGEILLNFPFDLFD